jgi:hypothetical protein
MSDRIAVLHAGSVVGVLDRAEATQEALLAMALGHPPASAADSGEAAVGAGTGVNRGAAALPESGASA